jgi:hypothetical protein
VNCEAGMKSPKISAMVVDFAGEYIGMGTTLEERQNRLRSACSAWNMACAPEQKRAEMLDNYLVEYRRWNPEADEEDYRAIRQDMELLIREKQREYPGVIKQIVSCDLSVVNGQDHIQVASMRNVPED